MNEEINAKQVGRELERMRSERGASQAEIAKELGITPMAVSQYERGERIPRDILKIRIANTFKRSVGELFYGESKQLVN